MKQIKTYQQLCIFIFLIVLSYQVFQKTIIVSDYYVNTANYIANCINKAQPEMHCDGKCQMKNKLEESNENDPQKPLSNNHHILEIVLFLDDLETFNCLKFETDNQNFYSTQSSKTSERPHPIFRPPIV